MSHSTSTRPASNAPSHHHRRLHRGSEAVVHDATEGADQDRGVGGDGDVTAGFVPYTVADPTGAQIRRRGFALRRELGRLRRVTAPMREVVGRLIRDDTRTGLHEETTCTTSTTGRWARPRPSTAPATTSAGCWRPTSASRTTSSTSSPQTRRLGGDHHRAHRGHRLLRPERDLPRLLPTGGFVTSAVLIAVGVGGLYTLMRRRGWL